MTNRHPEPTPGTPTLIEIIFGAVVTSTVITAVVWMGLDLQTSRDAVGFGLGMMASSMMLGQTAAQVIRRETDKISRRSAEILTELLDEGERRAQPPDLDDQSASTPGLGIWPRAEDR